MQEGDDMNITILDNINKECKKTIEQMLGEAYKKASKEDSVLVRAWDVTASDGI